MIGIFQPADGNNSSRTSSLKAGNCATSLSCTKGGGVGECTRQGYFAQIKAGTF